MMPKLAGRLLLLALVLLAPRVTAAVLLTETLTFDTSTLPAPWQEWPGNYGSGNFANQRINAYSTDTTHRILRPTTVPAGAAKLEISFTANTDAASSTGGSHQIILTGAGGNLYIMIHGYGNTTSPAEMAADILKQIGGNPATQTRLSRSSQGRVSGVYVYTVTVQNGTITYKAALPDGTPFFETSAVDSTLKLSDLTRIDLSLYVTTTMALWADSLKVTITGNDPPTLTTVPASSVTQTGATLGGNVTSDGGPAVTQRGVVYGAASGPTLANATSITSGAGIGAFTVAAGSLSPGVTYYARAFATNSIGTAYGNEVMFSTLGTPGIVNQPARQGAVAAGSTHSVFVKTDGSMWGMGSNAFGQLGLTGSETRLAPVQLASGVASVAAGHTHTVFLKIDGTLWAMGGNQLGQLGDGTTVDRKTPVQIASNVRTVAAGPYFTLFIKTDGTLWAAGYNGFGQLGDATRIDRSTPVQMATAVVAMAAGGNHTLFLKTDGTLWSTGYNLSGQLGNGSTTDRITPSQVASEVVSIASGYSASLFIKTDGTLWAMGENGRGQLGDGTLVDRTLPVQIATGVAWAAAGDYHSMWIKTDGTLWVTGESSNGQLGTGVLGVRTTPVQMRTAVVSAFGGLHYSLFVETDGGLWAMGENQSGQLGDATTVDRLTPVQVGGNVPTAPGGGIISVRPAITGQPVGQSVTAGGSATFTVTASGTAPLGYQWLKDGGSIAGATTSSYTAANVQAVQAGSYSVVVSNSAGSAMSSAATLTVVAAVVAPAITNSPAGQKAVTGSNVTFRASATGTSPLTYQWRKDAVAISGATDDSLVLPSVPLSAAGSYSVVVANSAGSVTSAAAVLSVVELLAITAQPTDGVVSRGDAVTLAVTATGNVPLVYQWRKNGVDVSGATSRTLAFATAAVADSGSYTVTITDDSKQTVTSRPATLTVSPRRSRIKNFSLRTTAGQGSGVLIGGVVIGGQGPAKTVLVRGVGPALSGFGVANALDDPLLALYSNNVKVAENDNWGDAPPSDQVEATARAVGAFPLPAGSKDAALVVKLNPGAYSAQIVARSAVGIGLVEIYDVDAITTPTRLVNVSARAVVGVNESALIAGFVVEGDTDLNVLLRGIGPGLSPFGVTGVLANPQLVLQRSNEIVGANDDWGQGDGIQSLPGVFTSVGAFALPADSRDAALVATLKPGAYTVRVIGAGATTGVGLVEVYELP